MIDFVWAAILFYAIFTVILYFGQRNFLYFPAGERESIESLTGTHPEILKVTTQDDLSYDAWYWPAKTGQETLIFFHGNGQAYQYWVNKMMTHIRLGYGVLFTDYRGYGGFKGRPSEQGIYKDARAFITTLNTQKNILFDDMIFYGESLGTGVAVQMATEFTPKALILESPYSGTNEVAKARFPIFPVDFLMKDQYRSIDKITALKMPKLFLHAQHDGIIPIRFGKALFEAAPEPKIFITIKNGGHNDLYENGAPLHIANFLSKITLQ